MVEVKPWIVAGLAALAVALCAAPGASAHAGLPFATPFRAAAASLAAAPATAPVWSVQSSLQVVRPNGVFEDVSCTTQTACVAVGETINVAGLDLPLAEQWDGTDWTSITVPRPSGSITADLNGVSCASSTDCEAVGRYYDATGHELPFAEGWNGSVWTVQRVPVLAGGLWSFLSHVSCSSGTDTCEAVGVSDSGDGTVLDRWDGSAWTRQTLPPAADSEPNLQGVSCAPDGACEIVGSYFPFPNGQTEKALAVRWDGSHFSVQSPAATSDGYGPVQFKGVSCLDGGVCEFTGVSYSDVAVAERLSGGAWSVQSLAGPSRLELWAVSCVASGECEAVGIADESPDTGVVERFDGTSWSEQTLSTFPVSYAGGVSCTSASACTTAGAEGDAETGPIFALANRWNGSSWSSQASPIPSGDPVQQLSALSCFSSASCTSVGSDVAATGDTQGLIRHWTGTGWVAQTSVNPASTTQLTGVACPSSTICEAVGNTPDPSDPSSSIPLIERGNGAAWSAQTAPIPSGYDHVHLDSIACTTTSTCWAVGTAYASAKPRVALETWNGTAWKAGILPTPGSSTVVQSMSIACPSAGTGCLVTGDFEAGNTMLRPFAIRYADAQWAYVAVPRPTNSTNSQLTAVACTSPTACTAVGSYTTKTSTTLDLPLAESWNGTTWTIQTVATPSAATGAALRGISCLATSCHAVGFTQSTDIWTEPTSTPLAEYWNGSTWTQQTTPTLNQGTTGELDAVSCTATTTCEAAGAYAGRGGGSPSLIEGGG